MSSTFIDRERTLAIYSPRCDDDDDDGMQQEYIHTTFVCFFPHHQFHINDTHKIVQESAGIAMEHRMQNAVI